MTKKNGRKNNQNRQRKHKKSQIIVNNVMLKMSVSRQNTVICHQVIV